MTERLHNLLRMTDTEVLQYVEEQLQQDYTVHRDRDNFVFAVPKTAKLLPVLLCAHVDTKRNVKVDEPVILAQEYGVLSNVNGILGGDDRCGVGACLELAERFTAKPFLLFTNYEETGGAGMAAFLASRLIEKHLHNLYLFVSLDRSGHNEFVSYMPSVPEKLEFYLNKVGYAENYGVYTDAKELWLKYNIAHVNLSCGYFSQHTANEFVLLESYLSSIERASKFVQMIEEPFYVFERYAKKGNVWYKELPGPAENEGQGTAALDVVGSEDLNTDDGPPWKTRQVQFGNIRSAVHMPPNAAFAYAAAPKCFVCERNDRALEYDTRTSIFLCHVCKKQILKAEGRITVSGAVEYWEKLEESRRRSREANRNLNKSKPLSKLPSCPVCKDNKDVMWSQPDAGFICSSCYEYANHDEYNGKFWMIGHRKYYKYKDKVQVVDESNTKLLLSEYAGKNKTLQQCDVCDEFKANVQTQVIGSKQDKIVFVCPACKNKTVSTLLDPNLPPFPEVTYDSE